MSLSYIGQVKQEADEHHLEQNDRVPWRTAADRSLVIGITNQPADEREVHGLVDAAENMTLGYQSIQLDYLEKPPVLLASLKRTLLEAKKVADSRSRPPLT